MLKWRATQFYAPFVFWGTLFTVFIITSHTYMLHVIEKEKMLQKEINDIHRDINELYISVLNQQSGQRGFNLTGDPRFLEPFHEGKQAFDEIEKGLSLKLQAYPSLAEHVEGLVQRGEHWYSHYGNYQVQLTHQGIHPSQESMEKGKEAFDFFKQSFTDTHIIIEAKRRQIEEKYTETISLLIFFRSILLVFLFIIILYFIFRQFSSIRVSKQKYQSIFDYNNVGMLEVDLKQKIIKGNDLIEKIVGYTVAELKSLGFSSLIVPKDMKIRTEHHQKALEGHTQEYEISVIHKDGHIVDIDIKVIPIIIDHQVIGLFEVIKDLTESKQLEMYLRQSEKLSAIGQLAAGVAHEIRNPLTTIKGFIQLLESSLDQRHTKVLLEEVSRINLIVSEFLMLSKPQSVSFKATDLTQIIKNVVYFIEAEANLKNIQVSVIDHSDLKTVNTEENQMKQLFINLLKNAMESMTQGGKITIEVSNRDYTGISVVVRDEGCGIPQDVIERLGEPFFTTKKEGTGLGVMICRQIVKNHGGTFEIMSELNKGTSVQLEFPLLREETE
ncbi:ATP-binding protein [Ammoniphilus sp. YIM 78166]|uniref:ATP-binding protein n=1 Tax=Ammoniphilus sp. YIM 78166 TaxID=1644106 RepID=UPI00142F80EA|nr:ATP-binding protein [Ammoniphilus sp. YIM 78166]